MDAKPNLADYNMAGLEALLRTAVLIHLEQAQRIRRIRAEIAHRKRHLGG